MKPIYALTAAFALALPLAVAAQWQWIDKDGRKVFSDQAPPADVPARNILKRPPQPAAPAAQPQSADTAVATPPGTAPKTPAAPAPKVTGTDKELEAKKKAAEAEEAAKRKALEASNARTKAENCERAKRAKAALDSGTRIANTNAKGEREFMTDEARAAETRRINDIVGRECGPAL